MISELRATSRYEEFLREFSAEVHRHALVSHVYWAIWSAIQAHVSHIEYDFIEYVKVRMAGYAMFKEKIVRKC